MGTNHTEPWYRWPWPKFRKLVLERDGYRCQIGGPKCTGKATTVDHIVPPPTGPWFDPTNLRAACHPCNYGKAGRSTRRRSVAPSRRW